MTMDYNLWVYDITNRFSPTSLSHTTDGDGYRATAIISGVTHNGSWKMSLWGAYKHLRDSLLDGEENLLPQLTTTQRDSLSQMTKGKIIYNVTLGKFQLSTGSSYKTVDASTPAYGSMYENNESGSAIDSSTKSWITATVGKVDANSLVTFADNASGDRLVIGTGGAGTYSVNAKCDQTNAGGKVTTMTIQVNGSDSIVLDEHASDSGDHRQLTASGYLTLADNDYITLHVVSATSSDTITAYHTSITIHRIS